MKKRMMVLLIMVMALLLISCTVSEEVSESSGAEDMASKDAVMEEMVAEETDSADSNGSLGSVGNIASEQRKIIYNSWIDIETETLTDSVSELDKIINDHDGYISNSNSNTPSYEDVLPSASYECRIPENQYKAFMEAVGTIGNVTREEETTQDITMDYIDVESRLVALKTQEESLLAMLEEPGDLESLLVIQDRLMQVQYEIESYQSQKERYDDMVSYCTVTVFINQVTKYTPLEQEFGTQIKETFSESWADFLNALQSIFLLIIYLLPVLLIIGLISGGTILLIAKTKKKKERTKGKKEE